MIPRFLESCDKNKMDRLFYHLKELSKKRNDLAHTYIKGFTSTYDSPEFILIAFEEVAAGLEHLDAKLAELSNDL